MIGIGGTDEVVRLYGKKRPGIAKRGRDPIHILTGCASLALGSLNNFLPVLVRAGLKPDLIAGKTPETGIGIGNYGGIGMPEVGHGIDIIYGSCDIGCHLRLSCRKNAALII
jgi:hypothetical protein